ncbi:MAG: hypothetical protein FJ279_18020, partial [Planctomycetes bacterium]|nr:hypothetical protein [Planctomycetota bacterium]
MTIPKGDPMTARTCCLFALSLCLAAARVALAEAEPPFRLAGYSQDHGTLMLDKSFVKAPLKIGAKSYAHGLGTHSNSRIEIALGADCGEFLAQVGIDHNPATQKQPGSAVFVVKVDGAEQFRSKVLSAGMAPVDVKVSVADARKLELLVDRTADGYIGDHADWADARIVALDGKEVFLSAAFQRQGLPEKAAVRAEPAAMAEPETRTLAEREAREILEDDWLFQADDAPTLLRIQQEMKWTRELAARLTSLSNAPDLSQELRELNELAQRIGPRASPSDKPALPSGLVAWWTLD